jgi:hypothetical protein
MLTKYSENLQEKCKFDYLVGDERVILKLIKKNWLQECEPNLSSSVQDGIEGVCKHGIEPLGIIKCDDSLSDPTTASQGLYYKLAACLTDENPRPVTVFLSSNLHCTTVPG